MKRCLLVILILIMSYGIVSATEITSEQIALYGVDSVIEAVPTRLQNQMDLSALWSPAQWFDTGKEIIFEAFRNRKNVLKELSGIIFKILALLILCRLPETFGAEQWTYPSGLAGALGVFSLCVNDLHGLIGLGRQTMNEMTSFSSLLLPALSASAIGSGFVSSSGFMYALNIFSSGIILKLGESVIIPAITAFVTLAFADAILGKSQLKKLYELIGWLIKWLLKIFVYAYTGIITVTGLISGAIDSGTHKAAKLAISTMLPVVGGIISNTADTFLASAQILKNSIGTIGVLTLLYYVFDPFLRMGASYLMLKIVSTISGLIGSKQSALLEMMCSGTGYLLSLVGSCAMINFLSCACYLRMGQT